VIRISKREKVMVSAAAGFIAIFLVCQLLVFPVIDKRERLQRVLHARTRDLAAIQKLTAQYNDIQQQAAASRQQMITRQPGFTLFSFLEKTAGKAKLKDRIVYMKPSTADSKNGLFKVSTVEMKIQSITLEQLIAYLHGIESPENALQIKRISIVKAAGSKGLISATMEIESYEELTASS
jgi:general secretion pathway protein M